MYPVGFLCMRWFCEFCSGFAGVCDGFTGVSDNFSGVCNTGVFSGVTSVCSVERVLLVTVMV